MSVIIKGMEIPKSCADCPICYDQMECPISDLRFWRGRPESKEFNFTDERHPDCPLVSVPSHGRLIDADALNYTMLYKENWLLGMGVEAPAIWKKDIESAPTIVSAEEVYGQYTDTAGNFHWCGTHSGEHTIKAEGGDHE